MSEKDLAKPNSDRELAIIVPGERFADFITGLLGKPQIMERTLRGPFLVTRDDILSLHHLIEQRVHEQNRASLVQVQFKLIYGDDLSVEINSLAEFLAYAEVRRVITDRIELTWVYLIEFQQRAAPERQQIEVSFLRSLQSRHEELGMSRIIVPPRKPIGIQFRITHTMRSWGGDIDSLLYKHLEVFQIRQQGISAVLTNYNAAFSWLAGIGLFSILLLLGSLILRFMLKRYAGEMSLAEAGASLTTVITKLESLEKLLSAGTSSTLAVAISFYVVVATIASFALGFFVSERADNKLPSSISLTPHDEVQYKTELTRYERGWKSGFFSAAGAIVTGIISNILFVILW